MSRLVLATLVLVGILLGVRVVGSPLFQRQISTSFLSQLNPGAQTQALPETRSTGVSTEVPSTAAPTQPLNPPVTERPAEEETPLPPPRRRPAVGGQW